MKIFLDTADIEEIQIAARWGVLDGVTTNPTLYSKVGGSYDEILAEVCRITSGPVSAEVVSDDVDGMLEEGRHFAKIAPNIVVKVAMSENGLEAMSRFADEGIRTNCTLDLHPEPGPAGGEGRGQPHLAVRRPPRRHQPGRDDRHPRAGRDLRDPRDRGRDPVGLDPQPAPRDPVGACRRTHRHACPSRSSSRWSITR